MTVAEVKTAFEKTFPNMIVGEMYQTNPEFVVIIAFNKNDTTFDVPNSYVLFKNGKIAPMNPMDAPGEYFKIVSPANLIYDKDLV